MLFLDKQRALERLIRRYDMLTLSDYGVDFIARWEGLRLVKYDDGGRKGIGNCTIGVGHLIHTGPCDGRASESPFANGITKPQAFELFRRDAARFVALVNNFAQVPLNQNQFDALVDFSFNTGGGYLEVWRAVNSHGDVASVLARTAILPAWATEALKRRRIAEGVLFNRPVVPVVEEDMKPFLCWSNRVIFVGPAGPVWITKQSVADELARVFGPMTISLSGEAIMAMGGAP